MFRQHRLLQPDILTRCCEYVSFVGSVERVHIAVTKKSEEGSGVFRLKFPPFSDDFLDGNDLFQDRSSFEKLYQHFLAIERALTSENVQFQFKSFFLKTAWMLTEEMENESLQIYQSLENSELSCVKWFGIANEFFVIISEKADFDLKTYLKERNTAIMERINLCIQYARLVEELHKKEIAHMDLKPENVLVFIRGDHLSLKLTDFESCIKPGSIKPISTTIGYSDIEKESEFLEFQDFINHDLFSLGVNFMEILEFDKNKDLWGLPSNSKLHYNAYEKLEIFKSNVMHVPGMISLIDDLFKYRIKISEVISKLIELASSKLQENQYITQPSFEIVE